MLKLLHQRVLVVKSSGRKNWGSFLKGFTRNANRTQNSRCDCKNRSICICMDDITGRFKGLKGT